MKQDNIRQDNISKIATGQGNQITAQLVAFLITQQVNFTENLERTQNATLFVGMEEFKETIPDFSQGTLNIL